MLPWQMKGLCCDGVIPNRNTVYVLRDLKDEIESDHMLVSVFISLKEAVPSVLKITEITRKCADDPGMTESEDNSLILVFMIKTMLITRYSE